MSRLSKTIKHIYSKLNTEPLYNKGYSSVYQIHKYWSRKPWYIVRKYLKKYSKKGDKVLDAFCGSGVTGLESILLGRDFEGWDINPIAISISDATMTFYKNIKILEQHFNNIKEECFNVISGFYLSNSTCPKCGKLLTYKQVNLGGSYSGSIEGKLYCPYCCYSAKSKNILSKYDEEKMDEANKVIIDTWLPDKLFPKKFYKDRFSYKGVSKVTDMFSHRNNAALSLLYSKIIKIEDLSVRKFFLIVFSNTILHVSKLKGNNVRPLGVNNYWIPDDFIDENVWFRFENRFYKALYSKITLNQRLKNTKSIGSYLLTNKPISHMDKKEYFDYVFTDPPYGDAIQYSELSFVWNSWLNVDFNIDEEIIINPVQKKGVKEFNLLLCTAIRKIYDSLKFEGKCTICFQNKDFIIWKNLIDYCKQLGFVLEDVSIFDTFGSPFNKNWAKFSPKSDIYVTLKKTGFYQLSSPPTKTITVQEIVSLICNYFIDKKIDLRLEKLYDVFVGCIISELFKSEYIINGLEKCNIKTILYQCIKELNIDF